MTLLLKLLLAHLAGDFLLQPKAWLRSKEKKKLKAIPLYYHAGVHALLMAVLVWDLAFIPWAIALALVHALIDGAKLTLQTDETRRYYFFADQALHLLLIGLVANTVNERDGLFDLPPDDTPWLLATLIVFNTTPAAYCARVFIDKWGSQVANLEKESLADAGLYIGMLERLFVLTFIATNHWDGVGFLLTAKSVFRFGDLTRSKDRKLTEYILIGTLVSFGMAILSGIAYQYFTL